MPLLPPAEAFRVLHFHLYGEPPDPDDARAGRVADLLAGTAPRTARERRAMAHVNSRTQTTRCIKAEVETGAESKS